MPEMLNCQPDNLERFARAARFMRADSSCWGRFGGRECPVVRTLARQDAQILVLTARADITPDGITRLLQEVGQSVRHAHAEERSAVICVAVEDRGASARLEAPARPQIEKISTRREERQMMDDDCCCPACCG
jgi:hypothetical protein